jgi:hypothetical protein
MDLFGETLERGQPLYLGILGKTESITPLHVAEEIMNPLLSLWERMPDKMILPDEGTSSALLNLWAERNEIDIQSLQADYFRLGRKAGFVRDAMIVKECTHLLVFLGQRSQKYEQIALREAKKGKIVYTVAPKTFELTELVYNA